MKLSLTTPLHSWAPNNYRDTRIPHQGSVKSTDHSTVKVRGREQVGVKMGIPRPSFGRAKNYDSRGHFEYGLLGGPRTRIGLNKINSYTLGRQ